MLVIRETPLNIDPRRPMRYDEGAKKWTYVDEKPEPAGAKAQKGGPAWKRALGAEPDAGDGDGDGEAGPAHSQRTQAVIFLPALRQDALAEAIYKAEVDELNASDAVEKMQRLAKRRSSWKRSSGRNDADAAAPKPKPVPFPHTPVG